MAGQDRENFCCANVIILTISKYLAVTRFYRFDKFWKCQKRSVYFASRSQSTAGAILPPTNCVWLKANSSSNTFASRGKVTA